MPGDRLPDRGDVLRVALERPDQLAPEPQVPNGGERRNEQVVALRRRDRPDAAQQRAVRAGGRRCRVHAGLRDVHAVRGEPVQRDEPAGGPRARGDDRARRPQRRPFALDQLGSGSGLVAERQVQEDDEREPARRGDDDLRHATGHESVDEHDAAVGHGGQRTGEGLAGHGVRPGPAPGDRVLVYGPPRVQQPTADVPVVEVAATRRGAVVDAGRNDHVHRAQGYCRSHSARS